MSPGQVYIHASTPTLMIFFARMLDDFGIYRLQQSIERTQISILYLGMKYLGSHANACTTHPSYVYFGSW